MTGRWNQRQFTISSSAIRPATYLGVSKEKNSPERGSTSVTADTQRDKTTTEIEEVRTHRTQIRSGGGSKKSHSQHSINRHKRVNDVARDLIQGTNVQAVQPKM